MSPLSAAVKAEPIQIGVSKIQQSARQVNTGIDSLYSFKDDTCLPQFLSTVPEVFVEIQRRGILKIEPSGCN